MRGKFDYLIWGLLLLSMWWLLYCNYSLKKDYENLAMEYQNLLEDGQQLLNLLIEAKKNN